jgi:hypothetical protein
VVQSTIDVNARLPREFNPPPLVLATCETRRVDIVEMLLRAGANVDGVDDNDRIASFAAVEALSADVLAALLAHRPNLELRDTRVRITPLELSFNIGNGNAKGDCISLMLINAGASIAGERLCRLALQGTAAIQALLNRGVVVNQLRDAILLLAAGANVNARDRKGRTTFQLAVRCQSTALLSALIAAGADPSDVQSVGDISIEQVESARRDIAKSRLDFVRHRAWQVCIGLQWRQLDALQMCIILRHACGPVAQLIAFHQWWKIATTVKHFKSKSTSTGSTGTL